MVAQNTKRAYGENQVFRFVEGIWLHRKSRQIQFFFSRKRPFLLHMCAKGSEQLSYTSTMIAPCFPAQNINSTHGSIVECFSLK